MAKARIGSSPVGFRILTVAAGLSVAAYSFGSAALLWKRPR